MHILSKYKYVISIILAFVLGCKEQIVEDRTINLKGLVLNEKISSDDSLKKSHNITLIQKKEVLRTLYVTAPSGLIIRDMPEQSGKVIGKITVGVKAQILEDTGISFSVEDNGKIITGNWVKVKTYSHPYYFSEKSNTGYVFDGFLATKEEILTELTNEMKLYPELKGYSIDEKSHPFFLKGDFFGDSIR